MRTDEEQEAVEDISLDAKIITIKLNGVKHEIVSADSATATEYRNVMLKHVVMKGSGDSTSLEGKITGLAEAEPFLVSRCVFLIDGKGARQPITLETVKKWDNRAVKRLFTLIKGISDLDEKVDDKSKNLQSGTTGGSGSPDTSNTSDQSGN